eukprot:m.14968 g.14968  ORF g.14968 m.14968 type:complete len:92 (+) comp4399_c0_seq1:53-328(+)
MSESFFSGAKSVGPDDVKTAAFDARFPNQDQTKNCWQNYVDFHKCQKLRGKDYKPCGQFYQIMNALCPQTWINKWDEQREEGAFAHKEMRD